MPDFSIFTTPEAWIALLTLTILEVVLGLDNIVFISIVTDSLPPEQRSRGRRIGLILALGSRIGLLFTISWIMGLGETLFTILGQEISGRDLILGGGGLFLIGKATSEIFSAVELTAESKSSRRSGGFAMTMAQILVLDVVFSLDSVITAVGMADQLLVMVLAVVIAVIIMVIFANKIGDFVSKHKSMTVLALSFLLLIGITLVAESLDKSINKGYIYFAMAFSLGIELINLRLRKIETRKNPSQEEPEPAGADG